MSEEIAFTPFDVTHALRFLVGKATVEDQRARDTLLAMIGRSTEADYQVAWHARQQRYEALHELKALSGVPRAEVPCNIEAAVAMLRAYCNMAAMPNLAFTIEDAVHAMKRLVSIDATHTDETSWLCGLSVRDDSSANAAGMAAVHLIRTYTGLNHNIAMAIVANGKRGLVVAWWLVIALIRVILCACACVIFF